MDNATKARPITGLSPVRKRLVFPPTNNIPESSSSSTFTTTAMNTVVARNVTWKERARPLRAAICLYFLLCVSLSALMFTWTVTANMGQGRTLESSANVGLRNPFERVEMSRSMLQDDKLHRNDLPSSSLRSVNPAGKRFSTAQESLSKQQGALTISSHVEHSLLEVPQHLRIPDDEPVVQIINTRFMQHQPHLVELGLARLELLKIICLPTLQQQTSQNFLWVIRADPDLAKPVKEALLQVIQNATDNTEFHVVVLGSNENPNGFRRDLIEGPDLVWTKNYALLEHFHEAAQSRIVLETRLDADDGLHIKFVETMQNEAVANLDNDKNPNWLIWCAGTHVEWQYGTPWDYSLDKQSVVMLNGTEIESKSSSMKTNTNSHPKQQRDSSHGSLLPGLTRGCITPGLTKGYARNVSFDDLPEAQHHQLHWRLKQCKDDDPHWYHCLVVWKALVPCAIRGRTPTSAGMQFVLGSHTSYLSAEAIESLGLQETDLYEQQEMMWRSVIRRFHITKESMLELRNFLTRHLHGIAQDNFEGQCTRGHSCKNSSRIILKELMHETFSDRNRSAATTDKLSVTH